MKNLALVLSIACVQCTVPASAIELTAGGDCGAHEVRGTGVERNLLGLTISGFGRSPAIKAVATHESSS